MRDGARSPLSRTYRWHNSHAGWTIAFLLTALALLLRLPGYSGKPLWLDEAWRAALILDSHFLHNYFFAPTVVTAITSPVYAVLVKSVSAFWISPDTLRFSSLFPGVLTVPLAFAFIRKAGGSYELSILAGTTFALESNFIGYSKEMKPYMFEVFVHLGCLYAWFITVIAKRPSGRVWTIFYLTMLAAIFSTPTVIFLLPAFGITLLLRYGMDRDIKNLKNTLFGFCGLAVVVVAMYFLAWQFGAKGGMTAVWADGFPSSGENYFLFVARQSVSILGEAFRPLIGWKAVLLTLAVAALFITALAAGKLPERRTAWTILLFYFLFLLTICLANLARIWPLGALRPNLFLYGHVIVFLFLLAARIPHPRLFARILLLCCVLMVLWQLRPAGIHKPHLRERALQTINAHFRALGPATERSDLVMTDFSSGGIVGKAILAKCPKQKTLIVSDGFMASSIAYYTKYDSAFRQSLAWLGGPCVKIIMTAEAYSDPVKTASTLKEDLPAASDVWFVYSHLATVEIVSLQHIASRFGRVEASKEYDGGAGYFRLAPSVSKDSRGGS